TGEIAGAEAAALGERFLPALHQLLGRAGGPLRTEAAVLAATLKDPAGLDVVRRLVAARDQSDDVRLKSVEALIAARDPAALDAVAPILADAKGQSPAFRGRLLGALARLDDPRVAQVVLADYPGMEPDLQPRAVELPAERPAWARQLLR